MLKRSENQDLSESEPSGDSIIGGIWVIINQCPIQNGGVILHAEKITPADMRCVWRGCSNKANFNGNIPRKQKPVSN
ncbi:MAG TPA: hypothetical protein DCY53_02405 [Desulfobacteraceae bacterium]|nr:hypothetical protein [Desulfobacteraceae bacterium]